MMIWSSRSKIMNVIDFHICSQTRLRELAR